MKRPSIPYGYQIIDGKAVPHPEESKKLQVFFDRYVNHGDSVAAAAAMAEIQMVKESCRRMLTNPVYLGTDYYPQLITPDLMEKARQAMAVKRKGYVGRKGSRLKPIPVRTQFTFIPGKAPKTNRASWLYDQIRPIK